MPGDLISVLSTNPYFSAGAGLLGVGTGLAIARAGWRQAVTQARRSVLISLEIPSKDRSFQWFMEWMSAREGQRTQHVSVQTSFHQFESGEVATRLRYHPSVGDHWLRYKHKFIHVHRSREKNVVDMTTGSVWETVTLTTLGRDRSVFESLLEDARQVAQQKEEGSTVLYTPDSRDWRRFGFPRKRRPLHSVILPDNLSGRIVSDVREFLQNARWYIDRGIPYRRGYLLHGPPGCGKSSFITALAGELGLNICILNFDSKGLTDETLHHLLNNAPQRSIILLEDVDASVDAGNHARGITFSGLLNALDGVTAPEGGGRILFMTTNHMEKLQPALIRPGRVDFLEYVGLATREQVRAIFLKFFPDSDEAQLESFAAGVTPGTVSMAQLQGYLMSHKHNAADALTHMHTLAKPVAHVH